MTQARLFRILDIPQFLNKKTKTTVINNRYRFTKGNQILLTGVSGFFSLFPKSVFTVVQDDMGQCGWLSQLTFDETGMIAWVDMLSKTETARDSDFQRLIEYSSEIAGNRGMTALGIVMDEGDPLIPPLRAIGFSACFFQSILCAPFDNSAQSDGSWQAVSNNGLNAFGKLEREQVPAAAARLFRNTGKDNCFVFTKGQTPLSVAKAARTRKITYIEPIFHPEITNPSNTLQTLAKTFNADEENTLYATIPGFQGWIEPLLIGNGWQLICKQTVYVKYLAVKAEEMNRVGEISKMNVIPLGLQIEKTNEYRTHER